MNGQYVTWTVVNASGEPLLPWSDWASTNAYYAAMVAAGYRGLGLMRTGRYLQ